MLGAAEVDMSGTLLNEKNPRREAEGLPARGFGLAPGRGAFRVSGWVVGAECSGHALGAGAVTMDPQDGRPEPAARRGVDVPVTLPDIKGDEIGLAVAGDVGQELLSGTHALAFGPASGPDEGTSGRYSIVPVPNAGEEKSFVGPAVAVDVTNEPLVAGEAMAL